MPSAYQRQQLRKVGEVSHIVHFGVVTPVFLGCQNSGELFLEPDQLLDVGIDLSLCSVRASIFCDEVHLRCHVAFVCGQLLAVASVVKVVVASR